jgi:hypothetical protein
MKIKINSIEHDIVKIHPARTNSRGERVFNILTGTNIAGKNYVSRSYLVIQSQSEI